MGMNINCAVRRDEIKDRAREAQLVREDGEAKERGEEYGGAVSFGRASALRANLLSGSCRALRRVAPNLVAVSHRGSVDSNFWLHPALTNRKKGAGVYQENITPRPREGVCFAKRRTGKEKNKKKTAPPSDPQKRCPRKQEAPAGIGRRRVGERSTQSAHRRKNVGAQEVPRQTECPRSGRT